MTTLSMDLYYALSELKHHVRSQEHGADAVERVLLDRQTDRKTSG